MSLLFKLINSSKYGGAMRTDSHFSRGGSDAIMAIQEPVGYLLFTPGNIDAIMASLRVAHPDVTFSDVQDVMLNGFYTSGSQRANFVDHEDTKTIKDRVNIISVMTIQEVNRRLGNNLNLQKQYEMLLRFPNRLAPVPRREDVYSTEIAHTFFTDPKPQKKAVPVRTVESSFWVNVLSKVTGML